MLPFCLPLLAGASRRSTSLGRLHIGEVSTGPKEKDAVQHWCCRRPRRPRQPAPIHWSLNTTNWVVASKGHAHATFPSGSLLEIGPLNEEWVIHEDAVARTKVFVWVCTLLAFTVLCVQETGNIVCHSWHSPRLTTGQQADRLPFFRFQLPCRY